MEHLPIEHSREELRTEFLAVLSASRELDPVHDAELADVFIDHVDTVYGCRAPVRSGSRLGHLMVPIVAGAALLAFLLGASIPGAGGDARFNPMHAPAGYGDHHFWGGPIWHVGPPPDSGHSRRSNV